MNEQVRRILERSFAREADGIVVEEGLVRYDRPGHTKQASRLDVCHEGRYSAGYYAFGTLLGKIDEASGLATLEALSEMQITAPGHPDYGGFLWYREEAFIQDSNAAFFILMPLVTVRLCKPDALPEGHIRKMDEMLRHAAVWFSKECRTPEIYYPNKTMSDGAMLLAIAHLVNEPDYLEEGIAFFRRWEEYTVRRGWGWGENISLVYQGVMLNALSIATRILRERDTELADRLLRLMDELKSILRFHGGEELVPSIRSYNFQGETKRGSLLWPIAGVTGISGLAEHPFSVNDFVTLLLFERELAESDSAAAGPEPAGWAGLGRPSGHSGTGPVNAVRPALLVPRVREERIFDAARSYSWIGRNSRLGSINRFPVIPGSYQHPSWGLGWQSFPVSFSVREEQVAFLRWYVDDGETVRTHPAEAYRTAYLMPALFAEPLYPEVETRTAQRDNALLILRSMSRIHNRAAEIADEWVIHRFKGAVESLVTSSGREWLVLRYPHCAVAVTALRKVGANDETRTEGEMTAEREEGRIKLRQVLYAGPAERLDRLRVESGWAVICLDDCGEEEDAAGCLEAVSIEDETPDDREVPREPLTLPRRIRLRAGAEERVSLVADPYETQPHY